MCKVAGCGEEITDGTGSRGGLPICHKCRHTQYTGKKRGLKWLDDRLERLKYWEARISYLSPHIEQMISEASHKVAKAKKSVRRAEARASS